MADPKPIIGTLTRKDVLNSEKNRLTKEITKLDIDILVLERTDPKLQVGKKVAAVNPQTGQPMSYAAVTAKEMLEESRTDREGHLERMKAVEILMSKEPA